MGIFPDNKKDFNQLADRVVQYCFQNVLPPKVVSENFKNAFNIQAIAKKYLTLLSENAA